MGIITLAVLGLTLLGMALGALFGFLRGRERALLRLVLVVISAFLALASRGVILDTLMNINIEGATLKETMSAAFSSGDIQLPAAMTNLIFAFIEIIVGFIAYFIMLFVLRFLTWLLVFPFLKLLIGAVECICKRKLSSSKHDEYDEEYSESEAVDESSDENDAPELAESLENTENEAESLSDEAESVDENASEDAEPVVEAAAKDSAPVKTIKLTPKKRKSRRRIKTFSKHRGQGALVGLLQGVLLSYFLFAPLTCLLTQVNRIANLEIDGNALIPIPEEVGINEYTESAIGKLYSSTGSWYYEMMTTTKDENGNKISLNNVLNAVATIFDFTNTAYTLADDMEILKQDNVDPEEMISSLNNLSEKFISMGNSLSEIDESTKTMIKDLIIEMSDDQPSDEDLDYIDEMLTPEVFVQAGNLMKSYADYEQVKLDGSTLTQEQANEMVQNAYDSIKLVGEIEFNVNEADKPKFKEAIDSNSNITGEDVNTLYKSFGLTVEDSGEN